LHTILPYIILSQVTEFRVIYVIVSVFSECIYILLYPLFIYLHSVDPYNGQKQPYSMLKKSVMYITELFDTK